MINIYNYLSWLILFLIICVFNLYGETVHTPYKRQIETTCKRNQFQCDNGQCIKRYEVCDGIYNCNDKSDEASASCLNSYCPIYAFRCNYGACISGDAECNGVQECVDNSDELSLNCPGVYQKYTLRGNCSFSKFQCDNGECISEYNLCDGTPDCTDQSDETEKRCSNTFCPSFGFRCEYGACITSTSKCDGNVDCIDASDENISLCNYTVTNIIEPPSVPSDGSCVVMQLPENGYASYDGQWNRNIKIFDVIPAYSTIAYRCDKKYVLIGDEKNFCNSGTWNSNIPVCKEYCPWLPLSGISIKATCEYNRQTISCHQKLLPGTIARIVCNDGYQKPNAVVNDLLRCLGTGEWDLSPLRCEQICGTDETETGTKYIVGGNIVNNTKVPWHVGIYSNLMHQDQNRFEQICGGTIVNAKIVLTAAHCFWDQTNEGFYDKKHFAVATGKYFRDYYQKEPLLAQYFTIDKFHTILGYNDKTDKYNNDLAILVLNAFIAFRWYIKPICLDWNLMYNERFIPPDWMGRIAGWGLVESNGKPSSELKVVDMPTIDYYTCKKKSPPAFQAYITGDKFCAGYLDRAISVCQGDSGGGLVFPRIDNENKTQFYLRGVVSSGSSSAGSCNSNNYVTFTNIQYHISFIASIEVDTRQKR